MANATKFVDNVAGNNANTGNSEAQAYADIATALAAVSGGGNTIYVQATGTPYTLTSTLTFTIDGDSTDGWNRIEGYTTTYGARDGRPVITSATNSLHLFTLTGSDYWQFVHLKFTHTAGTRGVGIESAGGTSNHLQFIDLVFDGCSYGMRNTNFQYTDCDTVGCEFLNCTSGGASLYGIQRFRDCYFHDNAGPGLEAVFGGTHDVSDCIFDTNTYGWSCDNGNTLFMRRCTFYGNTSGGLRDQRTAPSGNWSITDCVFYGNTGYGRSHAGTQAIVDDTTLAFRNAYGNNTSGPRNNASAELGAVTLTADPFANAAAGDFAPNSTAGGGALIRAAGMGAFPGGTTTGYADVGAVQHQDSGGSSVYVARSPIIARGYSLIG
jgi:hypothetical protein